MTIRVGVIGAGYLGKHHARIYAGLDGVRLAAVVDTNLETAGRIAGEYGARAFGDFREALPELDAVSIVTPTVTHHAIALECLRAGKDVLLEKPITETVAQADELIAEMERGGRILQVGHLERYNPAVLALAGYVDGPVFIESDRVSPMQGRGLDVDVTLDLMIHDVDIVTSLLGGARIKDVRVVGARVLTDKLDVVKAWVEYEGGVTALITASRIAREKARMLKLHQRDSYVVLDYLQMTIRRHARLGGEIVSEVFTVEQREPLREEIADFVECVLTRRAPRVSAADGRDALRTVLDITNRVKGMEHSL